MTKLLVIIVLCCPLIMVYANPAESVVEEIISIKAKNGAMQLGVLSKSSKSASPKVLLIVITGHPGVTRPQVNDLGKITTRQNGNFLVRSRHYLLSEQVATLLLDCRSDFIATCSDDYQASSARAEDIDDLVTEVSKRLPSIERIWAVSTSRGVITTASLLKHSRTRYSGIIHTAGTYSKVADQGLSFGGFETPQFIFHHKYDPCRLTPYRDATQLSEKWGIRLVTVQGGSGFRGDPCQAFTQHGFTGQEEKVAGAIRHLVETGALEKREID